MDPTLGEDECCLTKWAQNKINKGEIERIIASSLIEEISLDSLKVFLGVAERCLHDEPKERPTMAEVVLQLELALEKQQSRKFVAPEVIRSVANDVHSSNDETIPSVSTEQANVASTDMHTVGPPPVGGTTGEMENTDLQLEEKMEKTESLRVITALGKAGGILEQKICEAEIKLSKFDLERIAAATNQFSSSNKIGEGGFGSVYKAMLPTGQTVAVKMFSFSTQGIDEFKHEILWFPIFSTVTLLNYLDTPFMEKEGFFYEVQCHQLQWSLRFKIILGVARGVLYLLEGSQLRIIHRDLKPNNILLDTEMNPRISGFGIARTLGDGQSDTETRIIGTLLYLSGVGKVSEKLDVYSFGIILLEILSGKKNLRYSRYDLNLIAFAWELWSEGRALDLIDDSLGGTFPAEEALRCIHVGLCAHKQHPYHRPTMRSVIVLLLDKGFSLQEKVAEAASYRGSMERSGASDLENEYLESSFIASRTFEYNEHNGIPDLGASLYCLLSQLYQHKNMYVSRLSDILITLCLFWQILVILASNNSANYSPPDSIAISCGSSGELTAPDGRVWIGDSGSESSSSPQINGKPSKSRAIHQPDSVPYKTARVSHREFSYVLPVEPGQKFVRLHFYKDSYKGFKRSKALFTVKAGPYTFLSNFSAADVLGSKQMIREYCVNIDNGGSLTITFSPAQRKRKSDNFYAFVNGIEVVSMPTSLYFTPEGELGAPVVGQKYRFYIDNSTALELVQRLNVGGTSISPAEDSSMFRRWDQDSDYLLETGDDPATNVVTMRYTGTSTCIAPNKVYQTARSIYADTKLSENNLTWKIPVDLGFRYLIRLHCYEFQPKIAEAGKKEFSVS
ncbi:UNVERIFIED_CONTAM: Cysteine-rich receptor-like protein kinase [Sesamum calycinum]|uniref:Cysteine-rich receptor-like protein kinase n=1 Tax=Sesamum calycinum TaxID=2727403 RepID=A0AAW2L175_9LAMI